MPIHDREHNGPVIKVATNEWVLLANRLFLSGAAAAILYYASDIRTATVELRKDFNQSQLINEARMSKIEGQLSVFDSAVRMQTRTIEQHETTLQSLWSRIYEMNTRMSLIPKNTP